MSTSLEYRHLEKGKYLLVREAGCSKWTFVEDQDRKKVITTFKGDYFWHYDDMLKCDSSTCSHDGMGRRAEICTVMKTEEDNKFYLAEDEDKKLYDTCPMHSYGGRKRDENGEKYYLCKRCNHKIVSLDNNGN